MVVDGAHEAASAFTRSFGLSVVVNRVVCAPVMVRVATAEHGPTAPDGPLPTATRPLPTTSAAISTLPHRRVTRPPRTSPVIPAVAPPPRRSRRHRVRTPRPE